MSFFENKKDEQYTVIIGCGRLGANLATTLSDSNKNVLIIDKNKESFKRLSPTYGGLVILGDGTDFKALKEANIEKASAVIVVTNNDNTNIMISQIAKHIFHCKVVISRLYDYQRECVYREFDIDTICPAVLSEKEIDKILGGFKKVEV